MPLGATSRRTFYPLWRMGHGRAGVLADAQTLFNGAALASRKPDGIDRS